MTKSAATTALLISLLFLAAVCQERLITRSRTNYLKQHAKFQVVDYEDNIFKGWTVEEAKAELMHESSGNGVHVPEYSGFKDKSIPAYVNWNSSRPDCVIPVRRQSKCGASWAFTTAHMLSERCCIQGFGPIELSANELVSCDKNHGNKGCSGGWPLWAMEYIMDNHGLVPESCSSYTDSREGKECTQQCDDSADWKKSHACECAEVKQCIGSLQMKQCLQTGPISVVYDVCPSFYDYRTGIYECDCLEPLGQRSGDCIGYKDDGKECYWIVKNSWGTGFGDKGYVTFGCNTCGLEKGHVNANLMCEEVIQHSASECITIIISL